MIVSSHATDARGANQIVGPMFVPFTAVFLAAVEGIITFGIDNLLIISGVVLVVDLTLFLNTSTFRQEEILTKRG